MVVGGGGVEVESASKTVSVDLYEGHLLVCLVSMSGLFLCGLRPAGASTDARLWHGFGAWRQQTSRAQSRLSARPVTVRRPARGEVQDRDRRRALAWILGSGKKIDSGGVGVESHQFRVEFDETSDR